MFLLELSPESGGAHSVMEDLAKMTTRPQPVELSQQERRELTRLANGHRTEHRLVMRARIVLAVAAGMANRQIARQLGVEVHTVRKWRARFIEQRYQHPGQGVALWLADAKRTGRPLTFGPEFWVDVLTVVTLDPKLCSRPVTHWTTRELADELVVRRLCERIDHSTIARFLRAADIKPHQVRGWMNRKDDPDFEARCADVRRTLLDALQRGAGPDEMAAEAGRAIKRLVVSFDEKTGMQAKERIAPDIPMAAGKPVRQEYEYKRHGTLCLFAAQRIDSGQIVATTSENRTNEITADVLEEWLCDWQAEGYAQIDIVLDQLNTHCSQELVDVVVRLCHLDAPAPEQVATLALRRAWLSRTDRSIVFHYTPRHASWLNPIEAWFSVLVRKVLQRGSFRSKDDLDAAVRRFIEYFNEKLAKPYNLKPWKAAA